MDWEKGEESKNLEDRRRMTPTKVAVGGGIGVLLIMLIGYFLGIDPQKLNQLIGNAPGGNGGQANGQLNNAPRQPMAVKGYWPWSRGPGRHQGMTENFDRGRVIPLERPFPMAAPHTM
jgi:hypothetical protein